MTWGDEEKMAATKVIDVLRSDKYKKLNALFLVPFDLAQVPGYLDIVSKPLDLQTVSTHLHSGGYDDEPSLFWKELAGVFENAIAYHKDRPQTKWISKVAKDMIKAMNKERKLAEGGSEPPKKKLKLLLKPMSAQVAAASSASSTPPEPPAKKPKLSLKLKLSSTMTAASATTTNAVSTPSDGPSPSSSVKEPIGATSAPKPAQPKIRLSLKTSASKKSSPPSKPPTPSTTGSVGSASRGKELPKAVAAAQSSKKEQDKLKKEQLKREKELARQQEKLRKDQLKREKELAKQQEKTIKAATKATTKKKKTTASTNVNKKSPTIALPPQTSMVPIAGTAPTASASIAVISSTPMTLVQYRQCAKVLCALRRRQQHNIGWFTQPVNDKSILADYRAKIPFPMDLSTLQSKLDQAVAPGNKTTYSVSQFVEDLRRIFANCLRFNTSMKDSLRPVAVEVLETAEQSLKVFVAQNPGAAAGEAALYQPLLFCWKLCIGLLDTLYNLVNPKDGQPTALYFLHPVSYYCGGNFPSDYLEKVPKPMDFGTVTDSLLEGRYQSIDQFASDCLLVLSNCHSYYPSGHVYCEQATRLNEYLTRQLDQLARYVKSPKGSSDRIKSAQPVSFSNNKTYPSRLWTEVVADIRALTYTDKATKITEPAMSQFEKPVSLTAFPNYLKVVPIPMDLGTIDRNVGADIYQLPEDFEFDITLLFRNCETFNGKITGGEHLIALAKYGLRQFRRIFYAKVRAFEETKPPTPVSSETTPTKMENKKIKLHVSAAVLASSGTNKQGKNAPRISISSAAMDKAVESAKAKEERLQNAKASQPVPLHIAIARVKESFPLRRAVKSLQSWEADCARYFKELMRHPWISASRPKFIFHVPVPILFPELKEAYSAKVTKPMDLTTVECTLLAGNRYTSPEDVVSDVALVFANSIHFNKDGRDIGDPLSCAYYDASIHLLKYSRWLSLEILSAHVVQTDHVDESSSEGMPPFEWKLTEGNKKKAREEMEALVLKEPLEKSLEGDRYTWMEAECEKLMKALRHQRYDIVVLLS